MKRDHQQIRKWRVAKKIRGITHPRLCVSLSLNHIYAQVIDDVRGHTLAYVSTLSGDLSKELKSKHNMTAAKAVGELIAKKAAAAGVKEVVFDRGSRRYHGRVRALAESARQGGLKF
ncbi:MAG: 50S ribosomal protein L18 [Elusimicrobia bacterium]|nr:50S ribosomal protein L18 [Elusimicrobiota bacterium]